MSEGTLQLVLQGGALGVLVLVLVGLFLLARLAVPPAREFLVGLVAEQKANRSALEALTGEIRSGFSSLGERVEEVEKAVGIDKRLSDVQHAAERAAAAADAAAVATGQFPAVSVEREPAPTPGRGFPPIRPRAPSTPGAGR